MDVSFISQVVSFAVLSQAFIGEVMTRGGVNGQFQIDLAGAGFELAIVAGGIILGGLICLNRGSECSGHRTAC